MGYPNTAGPRPASVYRVMMSATSLLYAFQQVRGGVRGHLVTITSAAEQAFLMANYGTGPEASSRQEVRNPAEIGNG